MKNYILPYEYYDLSESDQDWYAPEYEKYKIKKVRRYDTCDLGHTHFMGWETEATPIGNPYRYAKVDVFTHNLNVTLRMTRPLIIDSMNNSNVIMKRVLKNEQR